MIVYPVTILLPAPVRERLYDYLCARENIRPSGIPDARDGFVVDALMAALDRAGAPREPVRPPRRAVSRRLEKRPAG